MPSPFTSSFASAAAGNVNGDTSSSRARGGEGSGDWSRNRVNGATTTFRRPSLAANLSHQRETSQSNTSAANQNAGVYVPPHMNANYHTRGGTSETRYSRDQLLDLFRAQSKAASIADIGDLYMDGWNPTSANGMPNGSWSRKDDSTDGPPGPEICWRHDGNVQPLGLTEMTDEEQMAFSGSVNSPIKAPTQNANKDTTPSSTAPGRRTSVTNMQTANSYNTTSPSTRPGNRRRESSDFPQNLVTSPTSSSRFGKEDNLGTPPPSLLRRRTDFKENALGSASDEKGEGKYAEGSSPFAGLKRTATGPVGSSLNGPTSPWSAAPQSAGFAPMGTFGSFSLGGSTGQPPTPGDKKPGYGSLRGESRFKGLMNSESSEDLGSKIKEKASVSSLERLAEVTNEPAATDWGAHRAAMRNGDSYQAGSAALGGDDASSPRQAPSRFGESRHSISREDLGFSAVSSSSEMASFHELMQRREVAQSQMPPGQIQGHQIHEPMSPTNTNPYQSPEGEKALPEVPDTDGHDHRNPRMPAATAFAHPSRIQTSNPDAAASDRSRTSSAGASRGFPSLGSLGGFAGLGGSSTWSAAPGVVGTPSRAMPSTSIGFGDATFGGLDDMTSPTHGHAAGSAFFGAPGNGSVIGRGSKLGSLFPSAMQEQMRGDQLFYEAGDMQHRGLGNSSAAVGTSMSLRGNDGPGRAARGPLDEVLGNMDIGGRGGHHISSPFNEATPSLTGQASRASQPPFSSAFTGTPSLATASNTSYFPKSQDQDRDAANQMPATQQKQMVMPDRMRWIYRDPQGTTQGPWSGLEMHDWYKAGFFSPELQVKKLEDADYEPLAQLIRRIGNSREPFLVPQIGIPHGSADTLVSSSAQPSGAPSTASVTSNPPQPPFASSFPSFGTTLTAEQQNALERRKQEEQFLMARQKEHLAQQQVMIKQQMSHIGGAPHGMHSQQLHHHSSAHSLQSQPSYGSITSPTGYQPSPAQGPIQPPNAMSSFFDSSRSGVPNLGAVGGASEHLPPLREDDLPSLMERLNTQRQAPVGYGAPPQSTGFLDEPMHQRQVQQMLLERQRLQQEQEQYDMVHPGQDDSRQAAERFEQFKYLRSQMDEQPAPQQPLSSVASREQLRDDRARRHQQEREDYESTPQAGPQKPREHLSLSEQVQKAVKESPAAQPQSPWAKVDSGLPQPFPPPQSTSPLPAPSAQRNRQNVADALNAESRSTTHTPSTDTPSAAIAPWAKESTEGAKGPSLKEIQAVEARKAAQQEEIAATARRQLAEQERLHQQQQQVTPAPGLPASVNWANSGSPAVPGSSAWARPSANKAVIATPVAPAKKTLAQIQKEEEARKNRAVASAAAASAANSATNAAALAGGKRYADLAGKTPLANATLGQSSQAWTTVGAGGKAKTPVPPAVRAVNASTTPQPAPTMAKPKAAGKAIDKQSANDELQKWTRNALSKGLNAGIPVDDFVSQLLLLPAEADIISDSIYSSSQTLDGRRFAEEFIRRRKLADKGIIPDPVANGSNGFGGGNSKEGGNEGKGGAGG
ncbi:MAG: hypothetical protein LQ348_003528, partial [Seirophora lacunosa]